MIKPIMLPIKTLQEALNLDCRPTEIKLRDHLGGFDKEFHNEILLHINDLDGAPTPTRVMWSCLVESKLSSLYPNLEFCYDHITRERVLDCLIDIKTHMPLQVSNFICCFNGSNHVSRQLLSAILYRFGWFHPATCSKNFTNTVDELDGHIRDLALNTQRLHRKFFLTDSTADFLASRFSFGHNRFDHSTNLRTLEPILTSCFVHLASESLATSYYPFVTEKFLYSVVTRGLFLSYAQPGWHEYVEKYYGFRRYDKIFDYSFDKIENPVERLVALISMLAKFSFLSQDDWRDLYELEIESLEYNNQHYLSGDYKKITANYA